MFPSNGLGKGFGLLASNREVKTCTMGGMSMWDKHHLQATIQERMSDYLLVVVSNRQPFSHTMQGRMVLCQREPGGLVTALHPVMEATQGTWIATGSGAYDQLTADTEGRVMVPSEAPAYALRRLFLQPEQVDRFYNGYCNEGLWPLCHIAYTRPHFFTQDWEAYRQVNKLFAEAILREVNGRKAFVWIQDFHLVLVAKYLKKAMAENIITALFWHIPWPNPEAFQICPQKKDILEGILAHDLVGFQIRYHVDNFLAAVDLEMESRIDREKTSVTYQNHETWIRAFPISVDFEQISSKVQSEEAWKASVGVRERFHLGDKKLLVCVDRIDYTKGIPERLRAMDRLLELHPEYREKVVLFQLGQVSRIQVPRYKQLNDEIDALVGQINKKHAQGAWVPIVFSRSFMPYTEILALYRMADACAVSSLHDGMNLVAKEFVASRPDNRGVLILSQFTGVSRELTDAILINPYDADAFAEAIHQAMAMPPEEQEKRMRKMRETVAQNNIYRWAGKVLSQLLKFEFAET